MSSDHRSSYVEAIREARAAGPEAFHAWFDPAGTNGYWDFAVHVLTPGVVARLERPYELTALEIGYGGGRLLNAACSFFGQAIGVDIHAEEEAVRAFLEGEGKRNFRLLRGAGDSLELEAASVDFVYSFIVLQHLPSFAAFGRYVDESARVLRPGGVAQLYFGRLARPFRAYAESPGVPTNDVSLLVSVRAAKRLARRAGLRPVDSGRSYRHAPDGYPRQRGGQSYVTLVKPG
jgi:SAM-dependent methyltransferase